MPESTLIPVHRRSWCAGLLFTLMVAHPSAAPQAQDALRATRTLEGLDVTAITERGPRPREGIDAFLQSLSTNDAALEVVVNQGRLLTLQQDIARPGDPSPLLAIGDPTVLDFQVLDARHIRLMGRRIGVTDLSIVTGDGEDLNFEVYVVADLRLLEARLMQAFPDAQLRLAQMREHIIVEGQARDTRQVEQILFAVNAFLQSVQTSRSVSGESGFDAAEGANVGPGAVQPAPPAPQPDGTPEGAAGEEPGRRGELIGASGSTSAQGTSVAPQIINLIRVPGVQQVMLKVQIAELNRTALRQLGVSWLWQNGKNAIGTQITGPLPGGGGGGGGGGGAADLLLGLLNPIGSTSTAFGVFDGGELTTLLSALRNNQVMTILAEPTLVALHGQQANFLAGGEFPVPVPQPSGGGGGASLITIQYKQFGVSLDFVPYILDDETVRLAVAPEASSLDFSAGVTIQGTAVPGIATRRTRTVVELTQAQTLAISGILQVELQGNTARIPGLGDLDYIGSMFRNNTQQKVEKELIILVTPILVEPMRAEQVPPLPGTDVMEPTDSEVFLKGRIEGRKMKSDRSVFGWDDPLGIRRIRRVETGTTGRAYLPSAPPHVPGPPCPQPQSTYPNAGPPANQPPKLLLFGPQGYSE